MVPNVAQQQAAIHRFQLRVQVLEEHLHTGFPRIGLLVAVQAVVVGLDHLHIVSHQLLVAVGFLLNLVAVGLIVVEPLALRLVHRQLGIPAANAVLVAFLVAVLLGAVELLGVFLLRVRGGAPAHEREQVARPHQVVLELVHQVVFHLHFQWKTEVLAVEEPEHVAQATDIQIRVLLAAVGRTDESTAAHIVGVVGLHAAAVVHLARQVAVVEAHLAQTEHRVVAMVVRTAQRTELVVAHPDAIDQHLVLGRVHDVPHRALADSEGCAVFIGEVATVEDLSRAAIQHIDAGG